MTYVKKEDKFCCLFGSILKLYFIQYSLVCICNGHVKTMVQFAIHVLVYNHLTVRPVTLVLRFEWGGGLSTCIIVIISLKDRNKISVLDMYL